MSDGSLQEQIGAAFGIKVKESVGLKGGDIARAYRLITDGGTFFAKVLKQQDGLKMLEAEQEGLAALGNLDCLPVPEVLGCARIPGGAVLLLEYLRPEPPPGDFSSFGRDLARMHNRPQQGFGWANPNYIGSLPQKNTPHPEWTAFYIHERLLPQYRMAVEKGYFKEEWVPPEDLLFQAIDALMPEVAPSLLHGDLWGGNFQYSGGAFYLIDPAVYWGHSEIDLAMSRLFGGFPESFYKGYYSLRPPQQDWEKRQKLYQLYYLLVHLNLFGTGYLSGVRQSGADLFSPG